MRKEIQKNRKRERGALGGRGLTSGPLAEAGPARPRSPPSPRPHRARARTAAPCRRGAPAELGRRVTRMRQPGRALVGHQERPAASASASAAICAPPLALSPFGRSRAATAAPPRAIIADDLELLSRLAQASSFLSATANSSASSFRVACSRSTALGESRASGRAHRSESGLRRPPSTPPFLAFFRRVSFALALRTYSGR